MHTGPWPCIAHLSPLLLLALPLPPLAEQHRIVAELEAEAAQIDAVRGLITRFEGKIRRVLDTVWAGA